MEFGFITTWQVDGENGETVTDFIFLNSRITADCDCSHEIKRGLLLRRKALTNIDSMWKNRNHLPNKIHTVKAIIFQVVMYGCENWTIKKFGAGEDFWESLGQQGNQTSQSYRKSTPNIHWKDWCWSSNILVTWCEELTDPEAGKDWGQEQKGVTEDGMVGWHHQLEEHEFGQTLGDSKWQGRLASYSPWGRWESDMT